MTNFNHDRRTLWWVDQQRRMELERGKHRGEPHFLPSTPPQKVFSVSCFIFYLFVFQWILCSSAASLASSLSSRSSMSSRSTFEKLLRHWWPWQPWRPDDLSDLDDLDGFREFQYGIFFCLAKWMSSHSSSKKLTLPLQKFEEFKTTIFDLSEV